MNRHNHLLPDFTRMAWVSAAARDHWQPKLQAVTAAWLLTEQWSVVDGLRDSCLMNVKPESLPDVTKWAQRRGCEVLPIGQTSAPDIYATDVGAPVAGEAWQYRVIMTRPELTGMWLDAWEGPEVDHSEIGRLLGFPECCRDFFARYWTVEKYKDLTWPQAVHDAPLSPGEHEVDVYDAPIGCSTLWRWMGLRLVPHLPCSFRCEATKGQAVRYGDFMRRNFPDEYGTMVEVMGWPVEWSTLHGIAEIRTPILKVSTRADATPEKYVVRWHGAGYPKHGAVGLAFPHLLPQPRAEAGTPASVMDGGPTSPSQRLGHGEPQLATDNGFKTVGGMWDAHDVVLQVMDQVKIPPDVKLPTVLDPGCGSGVLLRRFCDMTARPWWPIGIEIDPDRAANGRAILVTDQAGRGTVVQGDLFDASVWMEALGPWQGYPDLVVFMPGRLLEVEAAEAQLLREKLATSRHLVVYAYGDQLADHDGNLAKLCKAAGLMDGSDRQQLHNLVCSPTTAAAMLW